MDLGLKNRLALVTGSTHGLGKAIAVALAREGAEVIINGRHEETILKTRVEISDKYRVKTWACQADVTDAKAIKDFFQFGPVATQGRLDILVNNVGHLEKFGSFLDLSDADWMRCYDLVCMSAVRLIREALPFLTASGHGRIINISSLPSHQTGSYNPHYSAAKSSVNNLTKHLANVLGSKNILVNAICPSSLDGGGSWERSIADRAKKLGLTAEEMEQVMKQEECKKSPLCRMGALEDVANLVTYLASDKANFQTGHIYDIDGGITRGL